VASQPPAQAEAAIPDLADQRIAVRHDPQSPSFAQAELAKSLSLAVSTLEAADAHFVSDLGDS
jgi:hypothetical protein